MAVYLSVDGSQEGPYTAEQLEELFRAGAIPGEALYWVEGDASWLPINEHPGFARSSTTSAPGRTSLTPSPAAAPSASSKGCPACGRPVPSSARTCPQCGHRLKLGFMPKLAIGGGIAIALVVLLGIVRTFRSSSETHRLSPQSPAGQTPGSNARSTERTAPSSPVLPTSQAKNLPRKSSPSLALTPLTSTPQTPSEPVVSVGSTKDATPPPGSSLTDTNLPIAVSIKRRTPTSERDAPGDVYVVYQRGDTRWLTSGETSSQAKLSARNGTLGWVVNEPPTNHPDGYAMSYAVRPCSTLVLSRDGRTLATLQSRLTFIEE